MGREFAPWRAALNGKTSSQLSFLDVTGLKFALHLPYAPRVGGIDRWDRPLGDAEQIELLFAEVCRHNTIIKKGSRELKLPLSDCMSWLSPLFWSATNLASARSRLKRNSNLFLQRKVAGSLLNPTQRSLCKRGDIGIG